MSEHTQKPAKPTKRAQVDERLDGAENANRQQLEILRHIHTRVESCHCTISLLVEVLIKKGIVSGPEELMAIADELIELQKQGAAQGVEQEGPKVEMEAV